MVLVDKEDFQRYVKRLALKRSEELMGSEGYCGIDGKRIFKVYNNGKSKNIMDDSDFTQFSSDMIAFPIDYYVDQSTNMVIGEVMAYYNKKSITYTIHERSNIDIFLRNYRNMLKEIAKFPDIRMYDLVDPNVLYDEVTGFTLIDTYNWFIKKNRFNVWSNKKDFTENFVNIIFDGYMRYNLEKFTKYGQDGEDLIKVIECVKRERQHLEELIGLFRLLVHEVLDQPVDTFDDIGKYTKILTK